MQIYAGRISSADRIQHWEHVRFVALNLNPPPKPAIHYADLAVAVLGPKTKTLSGR